MKRYKLRGYASLTGTNVIRILEMCGDVTYPTFSLKLFNPMTNFILMCGKAMIADPIIILQWLKKFFLSKGIRNLLKYLLIKNFWAGLGCMSESREYASHL